MNNKKYYEQLKQIKQDLNMDWFILKEENVKDPSKCAYAILVDSNFYRKYIGEVGPLIEEKGFAIKIKKTDFTKLFKGKNSPQKIYEFLNEHIDLNDIGAQNIKIAEDDIDYNESIININYGRDDEPENYFGTIVIMETTINTINNYNYNNESIGG